MTISFADRLSSPRASKDIGEIVYICVKSVDSKPAFDIIPGIKLAINCYFLQGSDQSSD